jgi:triosephosphate isomerase (TIM)
MNQRTPLIAGNWKMYKTIGQAADAARQLAAASADVTHAQVMIAPPFTALSTVAGVLADSSIFLGAQNMFWADEGAFTGEISPAMLADIGCRYVIVGHSERRHLFGETDDLICKKVKAALDAHLTPILCVGETESEREAKKTFSILDKQVEYGLKDMILDTDQDLVIAYEPVWAIGTGKTAQPEQVDEVHSYLRELAARRFGKARADAIRILYGGSVKPGNVSALMALPDVDGALVGGASLEPDTFMQIINFQ